MRTTFILTTAIFALGCQLDQNLGGGAGGATASSTTARLASSGGATGSATTAATAATTATTTATTATSSSASTGSGMASCAQCETVASADHPNLLLLGADAVYWHDEHDDGGGELFESDKATLGKQSLANSSQGFLQAFGLAVDASHLYFTSSIAGNYPGGVQRIPILGGAIEDVGQGPGPGGYPPHPIAFNGARVYWSAFWFDDPSDPTSMNGELASAPLDGSSADSLATGKTAGADLIAIDDSKIYWASESNPNAQWMGGLESMPIAGGAVTELAAGPIGALAVDATDVYYVDANGLERISKSGGAATLVSAAVSGSIALDDASVYAVVAVNDGPDTAQIVKVAKSGGTPSVLAEGPWAPTAIAVDDTHVYWADLGWVGVDGSILRTVK